MTESEREENRFAVHFYMGNTLALQGNFKEAAYNYNRALMFDGEKHKTYYNLSIMQRNLGRPREAIVSLDSALDLEPDYEYARSFRDLIALEPGPPGPGPNLDSVHFTPDSILDTKDLPADSIFDTPPIEPERIGPELAQSWYLRGSTLLETKLYEDAIECFDTAIGYRPDYVHAWYNRGRAHHFLAQHDSALASYNTALRYDSANSSAWCGRALALSRLDQHDAAVASCDSSLRYRPGFADAWHSRAYVLMKLSRYDKAVDCYDSALSSEPYNHLIWHGRGLALRSLGQYQEAADSFRRALSYHSDDPILQSLLNDVLNKTIRFQDSLNLDSVLDTQPRNSWQ